MNPAAISGEIFTGFSDEDLISEYQKLMKLKYTGRDSQEVQEDLMQVTKEAKNRDLNLYGELAKRNEKDRGEIQPEHKPVELIETPNSSSIHSYGYDELLKVLYVRFKSSETVYSFSDVPKEVYGKLEKAESKGSFIARNIKGKFSKQ